MWIKIEEQYYLNPTIYGRGFLFRNDDLDGSRILVKKMKTSRRKCLKVIREIGIPIKLTSDPYDTRDMIGFKLMDCHAFDVKWLVGECPRLGLIEPEGMLAQRPLHQTVINEEKE